MFPTRAVPGRKHRFLVCSGLAVRDNRKRIQQPTYMSHAHAYAFGIQTMNQAAWRGRSWRTRTSPARGCAYSPECAADRRRQRRSPTSTSSPAALEDERPFAMPSRVGDMSGMQLGPRAVPVAAWLGEQAKDRPAIRQSFPSTPCPASTAAGEIPTKPTAADPGASNGDHRRDGGHCGGGRPRPATGVEAGRYPWFVAGRRSVVERVCRWSVVGERLQCGPQRRGRGHVASRQGCFT